ncbi:MAG TPA: DUF2508 family protein [Candidatus Gallacutalibacter stercoravium]|nr:DUF2508 family protein [Candidatus Gallacutalibacter stercoravium]
MEGVLQMIWRTEDTKEKTKSVDQKALLQELREVSRQLACVEQWFQMECDGDLIEACIYQREALQARYRYLLSQAKKQEICVSPF